MPFSVRTAGPAMLAVATVAMGLARAQEPTRAEADSMQTKIDRVAATAEVQTRAANARPLKTTFSEREINAYLVLDGPDFLPSGITMPRVRLDDAGRVEARAVVDLDRVRRSRERSVFDPLAYITGAVEVVASGRIEGSGGEGRRFDRFRSSRERPAPASIGLWLA